ncbi:MAG TPA: FAD-binding protein [Syntrophorhabdaceae bacterium]|jgi:fumarate reductase flavoprotein subunit
MSEEEKGQEKKKLLSRRQILAGAGATLAAGVLAATGATRVKAAGNDDAVRVEPKKLRNLPLEEQVWEFEKQPGAVPASAIVETLTADIVVVGTGASGMPCTISAVETGAKVIAIEKLTKEYIKSPGRIYKSRAIGAWYGFSDSRLMEKRGIKKDKELQAGAQVRASLWRCDQRQINKVVNYGRKVADWWLDILEGQGINPDSIPIEVHGEMNQQALPSQAHSRPGQWIYWHPGAHIITAVRVEPALEKHLNEMGFQITYGTAAEQLIKEGDRVTGLIAKGPKGYVRINAKKAVILCTGGYEGNPEMMRKYLPEAGAYKEVFGKKTNTGDGYLMSQWIGARMDPWPHCPMTWDGMNPEALEKLRLDYVGIARQPWLYVNAFGERFMNENAPFSGIGKAMFMQPKSMMWTIFDERWKDDNVLENLAGTVCRRMTTRRIPLVLPMNSKKATEKMIEAGIIIKANSIEELAAKMIKEGPALGIGGDLNVDVFKATVARYNELAKSGRDKDFGKDPQTLFPCDKPPYYAVRTTVGILVAQAGPLVNDKFQVMNKEGKVISGLYACGNNAGGFNQYEYSMDADIGSLARCCVTGYLAAKYAAGVPV